MPGEVHKAKGTGSGVEKGAARRTLLPVQTFKSFQYPVFRIFFGSMMAHMACMNMQMLVRSLLVYRLTGSAAVLGAMSFALFLPMLLVSLFGGAIADRMQKKHIILAGEVTSALVNLGVGISLTVGYLRADNLYSIWILVVSSIIQGLVMGLTMPSRQAIIPEIVGEEHLMNAISLNSMSMNGMRLLAPAAAGFLIDYTGFDSVFYAMTGMFLIGAVLIAFLPHTSKISASKRKALEDIKAGLGYIKNDATILSLLVFTLCGVVLSMPYVMLMPIFAEDVLKVGATGLGVLMSVSGAGAIVASLVLASLPNRKRGIMLLISSVVLGAALAGFSFSTLWYASLGFIALVGLGHTTRMSLSNTMLQYYAEPEYRGRVMSIFMMEFGLMSFGAFGAGLLAEAVGAPAALGSFSIVLIILSVIYLFNRRIRVLD